VDLITADSQQALARGPLAFPVSPFDADGELDLRVAERHLAWLLDHGPSAVFPAAGTGEFFSLASHEIDRLIDNAVHITAGRLPVVAPAGRSVHDAIDMARSAERRGAGAILVFPPYLAAGGPDGLVAYAEAILRATRLPVIVYHRAGARYPVEGLIGLAEAHPHFIGVKDGLGDVDLIVRVHAAVGDRLIVLGGLPTAETFALPYLDLGVLTYSSAIFNFAPSWATRYHRAATARDHATVERMLFDFVAPYVALRERRPGYAVSIVKAGMRLVGRDAGRVRPPLEQFDDEASARLADLLGGVAL